MADKFTALFVAALVTGMAIRVWLALRHQRHVRAHRDAVPAAFASQISLEAHRKAADYTVARIRLALVDVAVGGVVLLALTLGGLLQRMFDAWAGVFDPQGYGHGIALMAGTALVGFLADLPLSAYRTFGVEQRFGFNRMTWRLFAADLAKEALLAALIGIPALLAVLWLMNHMGALWWLYVWLFWMCFNLLILLIYPRFIAPLFNRFSPLSDEDLRARIERLLERCGFRASGLFVMDGSKRSAHGNAYFTGLGASKRVVFFDTLIRKLRPEEIEAVLAHELGHYRLRHVWKRIGLLAAGSLALLAALGFLIDQPWFHEGLGMASRSTAVSLTLFLLVVPVFTFPLTPIGTMLSRRHEFEADAFAAGHARSDALVSALVKLYRDNASTLTPDPIYSTFYDSHPPAAARIARLQPT